jgi:hypothetical protein
MTGRKLAAVTGAQPEVGRLMRAGRTYSTSSGCLVARREFVRDVFVLGSGE